MRIVIITDEALKNELGPGTTTSDVEITWTAEFLPVAGADVYIDLLFEPGAERIGQLSAASPLSIVNSVETDLKKLPSTFIRINAWPGFLHKKLVEASSPDQHRHQVENIFTLFDKKIEWVPDVPGFISPRIISMIINEAYLALEENISGKKEIDTAMKLGASYPYGPFEWSEKIGLEKINSLLLLLSETNARYAPTRLLKSAVLR